MNKLKFAILMVVLSLVGYAVWIAFSDTDKVFAAFKQVGLPGFLLLCTLSFTNFTLRYQRWRLFMAAQGQRFPWLDGFICYLAGFSLMTTPGKVGESVRALFYKERHQVAIPNTLSSLIGERISDLLICVVIGSIGFFYFKQLWWVPLIAVMVCLAIIVNLMYSAWILKIIRWSNAWLPKFLLPLADAAPDFLHSSRVVVRPKTIVLGLLVAFVAWMAECFGFAWLSQHLGVEADMWLLCSVLALSLIVSVITPGGVGSAEAAMAFFLIGLQADPAVALVVTIVFRLTSMWFAITLGLLSLLYVMRGVPTSKALIEENHG